MRPIVDVRSSIHLIAIVLQWLGLAFVAPLLVAVIYGESPWPWGISAGLTSLLGLALRLVTRESREIRAREAFLVVAMSWLSIAAIGSLPYLLTGALSPVDAFFESMSGFTTTGATVITEIEAQPRALLFWRGLSQWLGGMGIIVLAIAVLPRLAVGGRQLMEAEVPGPEIERLTPRIRETARALWKVYAGLSLVEIALLMVTGVKPFEAIAHTFTTLSTGGFGTKSMSIEPFAPITQWVFVAFILLGGSNFALLYRAIRRGPRFGHALVRDEEFRFYLIVFGLMTLMLFLLLLGTYPRWEETLRHSAFQAISIMTTTGYASTDFDAWSSTAKLLLLALMFLGGSAGSTAGSIKLVRSLIVFKLIYREIRRILHPQAVMPIRLGERVIGEEALKGVMIFMIVYVGIFFLGSLALLLDVQRAGGILGRPLPVLDALSAVAASLGNVGPGFGVFGPMASYAPLPDSSKLLLAGLMWLGRLEIFPVLVLLTRGYWRT
jgi:trk system potassium uptake protein TrkH